MAYQPSPYLQRVGGYDAEGSIPPDLSSVPTNAAVAAAGGGSGSGGGGPQLTPPPGTASPDVNPLPAGTRFGAALRSMRKTAVNQQVGVLNALTRGGADVVNAATYLPREIGGFARDAGLAATGMNPSPNAGQPIGGITAPQLKQPYQEPKVNFIAGGQPGPPAPGMPADAGASNSASPPNNGGPVDNISAGNLATASKFTAPGAAQPDFSKVTGSAMTQQLKQPGIDTGVDIGGRHLNYGAMVDGVPTFSDGSSGVPGVAGNIPRTMTNADIAGLGARLQTAPAQTSVLASDALGYTPSTGQQVATLVRNAQQPVTGTGPSAQQLAQSDRIDIATQDPRSALGTAAHNLSMEAQYGSPEGRRAAQQQLALLTAGSSQSGLVAQQGENQSTVTGEQGANTLANTALAGQNAMADTQARSKIAQLTRSGRQVTLADGTIGLQDPVTGVVTPSRMADGTSAKALVGKNDAETQRTNTIFDNIAKTAAELAKTQLPPPGAPANWQPDPVQLREQAARFQGLRLGTDPATGRRVVMINGKAMPL